MIVAFLDFETNGVDPKTCQPTEVGALAVAVDGKNHKRLGAFSSLIWDETYPPQPDLIVELTGITDEMLRRAERKPSDVFYDLNNCLGDADLIVCHNVMFDKTVLEVGLKKFGMSLPDKEWLCTLHNFDWPKKYTCKKLGHLAYEHDIPHVRAALHRAIDDCGLLCEVFFKYDFEKTLKYAREPFILVKAKTFGPWEDGGVQVGIAKSLGFFWEKINSHPDRVFVKKWVRQIKRSQLPTLLDAISKSSSPFQIHEINLEEKNENIS